VPAFRGPPATAAQRLTVIDASDVIARAIGWEQRFPDILRDSQFLPGDRIQAGAGTDRNVPLFNCFVTRPMRTRSSASCARGTMRRVSHCRAGRCGPQGALHRSRHHRPG
jgi:hypothetical protein